MAAPRRKLHQAIKVQPGFTLAEGPFVARDDGTILGADLRPICVLGCPEEALSEQDLANGAAILALPQLIELARLVAARALTQSKASAERAAAILARAGVEVAGR